MTDRRGDGSVDPAIIKKLSRDVGAEKSGMDGHRTEIANLYKNAENDHNVHKQAFKWADKLAKMEPVACAAWYRSFLSYAHILGVDAQGELDLPPGDGDARAEAA